MKINIDTITRARQELIGNIIRTPTIRSQHLSSEINGEVFLKLENLQYTSSFKVRGAYTSITRLKEDQKKVGVIAMSAGNHAQAVAWWAKKERVNATIVMPEHAPLFKVMKTKSLGADVILKATMVDGVYTADPKKDAKAQRYERVTFHECISKRLQVMDSTAFSLCMDNNLPIIVFDLGESGNIERALRGEELGTVICAE